MQLSTRWNSITPVQDNEFSLSITISLQSCKSLRVISFGLFIYATTWRLFLISPSPSYCYTQYVSIAEACSTPPEAYIRLRVRDGNGISPMLAVNDQAMTRPPRAASRLNTIYIHNVGIYESRKHACVLETLLNYNKDTSDQRHAHERTSSKENKWFLKSLK